MALAAIEAGVKGLYVEKPFCRAPSEADRLITAADLRGTKIAVAHRNRYHPVISKIGELITSGEIGRLLEIKGHGLGDRRGGGEDLWVLGGHVVACRQAPDSWAGDLRRDDKERDINLPGFKALHDLGGFPIDDFRAVGWVELPSHLAVAE